jgi:leucyl aminopeptidase
MQTELSQQPLEQIEADALVVVAFEKGDGHPVRAAGFAGGWIEDLYTAGEFKGKIMETALLYRPSGLKCAKLLVIGGGKLSAFGTAELRKLAGAAVRALKPKGCRTIAFDAGYASPDHVAAAVEGALLGNFETDHYKTENKDERKTVDSFTLVLAESRPEHEQALARGRIVADSQNFTRELVGEPANRLSPSVLAAHAVRMSDEQGLECELMDRERMKQLGMGALLGVAAGSSEPPVLIIVRYRPEQPPASGAHLGLIGKGVTFDSGGISIKPSENMDKMKYDMAGGAAVLGAMRAIAQLKPGIPVTALIPAVENMPGGRAQRPGDIVTTLSGKTVEVLNTDAEGRLILADAITYAKREGCTHLIDAATLTGAIVVALGYVNAGVFTNDDTLLGKVMTASKTAGEKMWHMPLDEEYKEVLKSSFADMPNIGTRWGGAITAALFLKEFVESTPWVHLDIAGTAWLEESKPFLAKGPSGLPVRTLIGLAMAWEA